MGARAMTIRRIQVVSPTGMQMAAGTLTMAVLAVAMASTKAPQVVLPALVDSPISLISSPMEAQQLLLRNSCRDGLMFFCPQNSISFEFPQFFNFFQYST